MKGSEFDREVLKKTNKDISKVTLKDLDFFKTEGKIYIKPQMAERINSVFRIVLTQILTSDAQFFKESKLIDYSLLLFKVNWKKYFQDKDLTFKSVRSNITNPLYMMESVKEPGVNI